MKLPDTDQELTQFALLYAGKNLVRSRNNADNPLYQQDTHAWIMHVQEQSPESVKIEKTHPVNSDSVWIRVYVAGALVESCMLSVSQAAEDYP